MRVVNTFKLAKSQDYAKLKYLMEIESSIIDHTIPTKKDLYIETWTQTEITTEISVIKDEPIPLNEIVESEAPKISDFNKFVDECCELDKDYEVNSEDLCSGYRIWSQSAKKETYHLFLDYCKTRFTPARLKVKDNDKNTVQNGFKGVQLIPFDYSLSFQPS